MIRKTIGSFCSSLFWGAFTFWIILLVRILWELPIFQNTVLGEMLLQVPLVPLAIAAGVFVFCWKIWKNGLWHFLLSLSLIITAASTFWLQKDRMMEWISSARQNISLFSSQALQSSMPIYTNGTLITQEPFSIYYVDDGLEETGISDELVQNLVSFIQVLPEELIAKPAAVYLVEDGAFLPDASGSSQEIFGFSSNGTMSSSIRLITDPQWDTFTRIKTGENVFLDNPEFYRETIIHELAHLMDMKAGVNGSIYSDTREFLQLYRNDPWSISDYGATSPEEFFAEAAILYYMYPEILQEQNDQVFIYFDNIFKHYQGL